MKSIVFCSSQRFANELYEFIDELKQRAKEKGVGISVLHPQFTQEEEPLRHLHERERLKDPAYKGEIASKVYDHLFRKVKVADVCFIFNKNGYVGANVVGELFAAAVLGKMIYSLEDKTLMGHYPHDLYEEPSARKLIHEVILTPEELLSRLI